VIFLTRGARQKYHGYLSATQIPGDLIYSRV
jgi:hypothetical protein